MSAATRAPNPKRSAAGWSGKQNATNAAAATGSLYVSSRPERPSVRHMVPIAHIRTYAARTGKPGIAFAHFEAFAPAGAMSLFVPMRPFFFSLSLYLWLRFPFRPRRERLTDTRRRCWNVNRLMINHTATRGPSLFLPLSPSVSLSLPPSPSLSLPLLPSISC